MNADEETNRFNLSLLFGNIQFTPDIVKITTATKAIVVAAVVKMASEAEGETVGTEIQHGDNMGSFTASSVMVTTEEQVAEV